MRQSCCRGRRRGQPGELGYRGRSAAGRGLSWGVRTWCRARRGGSRRSWRQVEDASSRGGGLGDWEGRGVDVRRTRAAWRARLSLWARRRSTSPQEQHLAVRRCRSRTQAQPPRATCPAQTPAKVGPRLVRLVLCYCVVRASSCGRPPEATGRRRRRRAAARPLPSSDFGSMRARRPNRHESPALPSIALPPPAPSTLAAWLAALVPCRLPPP